MAAPNDVADFDGWATVAGIKCSDGRVISHHAFEQNDGAVVPLVWQHGHDNVTNVLGHAQLEKKAEGVYAYGFFNGSQQAEHARELIEHGDVTAMSIFANNLKQDGNVVKHGNIVEVSLVLKGANPKATIENVTMAHSDGEGYSAVIKMGDGDVSHEDFEGSEESDSEDESSDEDKTIGEILSTLTEEQLEAVNYLIAAAIDGESEDSEETNEETEEDMKHNVFEGDKTPENTLSHAAFAELVETAKRNNTTLLDELKHADYGIENIGYLFPDAKSISDEPITLDRDQSWVSVVMNGTKHSPFARIKSVLADIRDDKARAKGYAKKAQKKTEEVIKLLTRTTSPTTIYKKQKLDRDDIVDITDFNVVSWLKNEMKGKLNEEIARAILIGDGRTITDPDRIDDEAIRPILKENDLYAIHKTLESNTTDETLVDDIVLASAELEGSGSPTLFIAKKRLVKMLLLKDKNGRRLYETEASLAGALGVSKIVTIPQFEGLEHEVKGVNYELLAIVVDLRDYTIGSNAGAELGMAESFDIDFNQYKYLMETRLSGSLTAPYSALTISRKKA
jgi:caudovirus prohead protease|uniref:Major capsid protein n=1 Tax=Siphoviridae sp. ctcK97 TaxID=2825571 RepID=A0A8S5UAY3_9CAUD|nr:MAG TPA: major capsid protein [Siphoviridae sp. ctcK97]